MKRNSKNLLIVKTSRYIKKIQNSQYLKNNFLVLPFQSSPVHYVSESRGGSMSVTEQGTQKSLRLILDWSDGSYHDWI